MLRAFLIVWTVVAGLAATGLLYLVGWHPQATVMAERLTSPSNPGPTGGVKGTPVRSGTPINTAGDAPRASSVSSAPNSAASAEGPANTGSIGSPPPRPMRTVRRVEERPDVPASNPGDTVGKATRDIRPVASERKPAEARDPGRVMVAEGAEPAKASPSEAVAATENAPSVADDQQRAAKSRGRSTARVRSEGQELSAQPSNVADAAVTPLTSEPEAKQPQSRLKVAARPDREIAASEPVVRRNASAVPPRTLRQVRAAQAAERARSETTTRAAALERPTLKTANESPSGVRRQARMARSTRLASRQGSLEHLLDEFSRSGADFLHERTMKVGTRYLVERTTRHGTQYFYQRKVR